MEGLPTLTLWDIVTDVLEPPASRARSDPSGPRNQNTKSHGGIESLSFDFVFILEASSFNGSRDLTNHHPWYEIKEFGRVMAATRETSRFGEDPIALLQDHPKAKTSDTGEMHIENCEVGAEEWHVQTFELNNDSGFVNCQTEQQSVLMHHQQAKVTQMMSFFFLGWKKKQAE